MPVRTDVPLDRVVIGEKTEFVLPWGRSCLGIMEYHNIKPTGLHKLIEDYANRFCITIHPFHLENYLAFLLDTKMICGFDPYNADCYFNSKESLDNFVSLSALVS